MQLQALRIERFIDRTLTAREKAVQVPEKFTSSKHAERERERAHTLATMYHVNIMLLNWTMYCDITIFLVMATYTV